MTSLLSATSMGDFTETFATAFNMDASFTANSIKVTICITLSIYLKIISVTNNNINGPLFKCSNMDLMMSPPVSYPLEILSFANFYFSITLGARLYVQ